MWPPAPRLKIVQKSSRPAHIESAVQSLIDELQLMSVTPHVRELRAKAVTYARVIAQWETYPPTAPQIHAMLECLTELEEKVAAAKSDVSRVTRRPDSRRTDSSTSSVPPDGVSWSAAVDGARPRPFDTKTATPHTAIRPAGRPPATPNTAIRPTAPATSRPPEGTMPPVSAPRAVDAPATPGLLQNRRSR
jgi:hypothetical protein